jgi:hypothetical protein
MLSHIVEVNFILLDFIPHNRTIKGFYCILCNAKYFFYIPPTSTHSFITPFMLNENFTREENVDSQDKFSHFILMQIKYGLFLIIWVVTNLKYCTVLDICHCSQGYICNNLFILYCETNNRMSLVEMRVATFIWREVLAVKVFQQEVS